MVMGTGGPPGVPGCLVAGYLVRLPAWVFKVPVGKIRSLVSKGTLLLNHRELYR